MGKSTRQKPPRDVALVHGPTDDGAGAKVLRLRDGQLSAGEVRPVREGQPVNDAEVVRLKPTAEGSPLCEVQVLHGPEGDAEKRAELGAGPAKVSSAAYRRNWGQVFGSSEASTRSRPQRKRDLSLN